VLIVAIVCTLALPRSAAPAGRLSAEERSSIESLGRLLVEAINETDPARHRAAVPRIFAPAKISDVGEDRLVTLFESLHKQLGPLTYHHSEAVESAVGPGIVLHAYARAESGWKDLQMRVASEAPFRVTEFAFLADVSEPVYLPNGDITSPETLAWIDAWIDRLVADEDLAVSVLIAEGDRVVYERTAGFADAARSRRVTPATAFGMASGGKMFTAVVIAQLVEAGRLSWDDPVAKFLPDWPDADFARRCTVRQLLSHTSELAEYWTDRFEREGGSIRTLEDFVPFIVSEGTWFAPGDGFQYSNSNFIVAGLIAERVSGQSYFDLVRERVWKPAGMNATRWGDEPGAAADVAERLTGEPRAWTPARKVARSSSAGGAATTARDQLAFSRALEGGRLASARTLDTMTTVAASDEGTQYGLGFELARGGGVRSYGHGGIAPGCNFELRIFPERRMTLVVLNNQDNGAYDDLRRNLVKLITGER
jgi:CubicO group peptidase (beta-lactamase class C family)